MSDLKHTPGPWHVYLGAVVNERNMIVVPEGISEGDAKLKAIQINYFNASDLSESMKTIDSIIQKATE